MAVKATFPLAGRICPAHDGLNYLHGISGDEPSLGPSAPGGPPVPWHRNQRPWRARSRPAPGCAAPSAARRCPQGAAQSAPTRTPIPGRASRHASRVIAAGTARWSHPYRPCPRHALANGYEQSPAVNDGSLRSVLTWPFSVGARAALPRAVPSKLVARRLLQSRCRRRNRWWTAQIPPGVPWSWPDPPHRRPGAAEDRPGPVARPAGEVAGLLLVEVLCRPQARAASLDLARSPARWLTGRRLPASARAEATTRRVTVVKDAYTSVLVHRVEAALVVLTPGVARAWPADDQQRPGQQGTTAVNESPARQLLPGVAAGHATSRKALLKATVWHGRRPRRSPQRETPPKPGLDRSGHPKRGAHLVQHLLLPRRSPARRRTPGSHPPWRRRRPPAPRPPATCGTLPPPGAWPWRSRVR